MKKIIVVLFLVISFQTLSKADVRNFEINGISVGDNLLDYYDKNSSLRLNEFHDEYTGVHKVIIKDPSFSTYDKLQVVFTENKNKQLVLAVEGLLDYPNNFKECMKQMNKISSEIQSMLYEDIEIIKTKVRKHPADKTGKSKFININFNFVTSGSFSFRCYDWSEELTNSKGWIDGLEVSIDSKKKTVKKISKSNIEPLPSLTIENNILTFATNEKYYALLIANGNYDNKFWGDLESPINDVNALALILKNEYGFEVEVLIDGNREKILNKLYDYSEIVSDKDNLLIYYAGHGKIVNNNAFWIPANGTKKISSNWLNTDNVDSAISLINAKDLLVMIDSCYQGTSFKGDEKKIKNIKDEKKNDNKYFEKVKNYRSATVITSGDNEIVVDTAVSGHSAFAFKFIDILNKNDEFETGSNLYVQIQRYHAESDLRQSPNIFYKEVWGHLGGEFVFVKKN